MGNTEGNVWPFANKIKKQVQIEMNKLLPVITTLGGESISLEYSDGASTVEVN